MKDSDQRWKLGGGAMILVIVALMAARDLATPGDSGWDILLGLMVVALLVAAFFLRRFFKEHIDDIGEARFDTRNPDDSD